MARLDALVVGGQRHEMPALVAVGPTGLEIALARALRHAELLEQHVGIGKFEIVPGIFLLGLQEYVAVGDFLCALATVEVEIHDAVAALKVAGEPLEPVGQFTRDRRTFEARDLLKIGELRDLHAVAPAFPAESPGAQSRAL